MEPEIDIGYVWAQLQQARRTAADHSDAAVRERATAAVARWEQTLVGMAQGTLDVGSRTPTKAPAWVTLDVVTGGFATGGHKAGGPLLDHERALAAELGVPATRLALNLAHCDGDRVRELLASGHYRIDLPEEGALLVVAWLVEGGWLDRARDLLDDLTPWFDRLRFYPRPAADALPPRTTTVRFQDLAATVEQIDRPRGQQRVATMTAAVTVWRPLRDRAIALAHETSDANARLGTHRPDGWDERVLALATDVARAGAPTTARAHQAVELVDRLVAAVRGTTPLATRGRLHGWVKHHVEARGVPGTAPHAERRAADAAAVAGPRHADLRRALVARLRARSGEGGVELADVSGPIDADEAARFGVPAGTALPAYLIAKTARSWDAPLAALIAHQVVPSAEALAQVIPQLTAQVRSETLTDPRARRLHGDLYAAFRRRRGLLLLNYQHQVRFAELPWAAALEVGRSIDPAASARVDHDVAEVAQAIVAGFPQTIVPNKLIPELVALTDAAGRKVPLVQELAADIFMGAFTRKFVDAAQRAAELLAGRLYATYFAIDRAGLIALSTAEAVSCGLGELCTARAHRVVGGAASGNAGNGQIIEQSQILTTHNLAVLFALPHVATALTPRLRSLAERGFRWIVRQLRIVPRTGHEGLTRMKNVAYAWRQLLFFLSFVDDVPAFVAWARGLVTRVGPAFAQRVAPLLRGLELAAAGVRSDDPAFAAGGGLVLTGWTRGRPWLAP